MIIAVLVVLGLVLGSFVNAFIWRLHKDRDWINDRSECTHCHHKLDAADLIPVISWILLRGRCRYCHKPIEDSPLVELALPVLFIFFYYFWPLSFSQLRLFEFGMWLIFLTILLALAIYDLRWYLLPNKVVFPLIGLSFFYVVTVAISKSDWKFALSSMAGALIISGIFYAIFQISHGKWIGGGDVKLGIVLGLLVGGVIQSFLLLFVASLVGLISALPLIIQGKAHSKTQLPFGPFLIIGLLVVFLFGTDIINWYMSFLYV